MHMHGLLCVLACINNLHGLICVIKNDLPWHTYTVEPLYYGHLGTTKKCPDYQGVLFFQVSLYEKALFGTTTKCVDYAGVLIFKCPD